MINAKRKNHKPPKSSKISQRLMLVYQTNKKGKGMTWVVSILMVLMELKDLAQGKEALAIFQVFLVEHLKCLQIWEETLILTKFSKCFFNKTQDLAMTLMISGQMDLVFQI